MRTPLLEQLRHGSPFPQPTRFDKPIPLACSEKEVLAQETLQLELPHIKVRSAEKDESGNPRDDRLPTSRSFASWRGRPHTSSRRLRSSSGQSSGLVLQIQLGGPDHVTRFRHGDLWFNAVFQTLEPIAVYSSDEASAQNSTEHGGVTHDKC